MTIKTLWRKPLQWLRPTRPEAETVETVPFSYPAGAIKSFQLDIAPNDPLLAYFASAPGVVEIEALEMDSPALRSMKDAGVKLAVPLVSQGELIGLLNLGPRRSEQQYSSDDRRLLNNLATQAAPALRVAQLARQQQIEARERERVEQELRVARLIQQTLLPDETPNLEGWQVGVHWQPARAVSGDFYDFLSLPDGTMGIIAADVTDKGVPAALVMATARSLLRAAAERYSSPGEILKRANDLLCPDIPPKMFVTCLCMCFNQTTGELVFANAGHNLPIKRTHTGIEELRATGMPLGLIPGMSYEETTARLEPGEMLLMYSDGLVEAHNPQGDMYGFPRLRQRVGEIAQHGELLPYLMQDLETFTGVDWEQEDDVTLVVLERSHSGAHLHHDEDGLDAIEPDWRTLDTFSVPSAPGNERLAMDRVAQVVEPLGLPKNTLERLKTAVAETTMNAMEHGNKYREDLAVEILVFTRPGKLAVRITDRGGERTIPEYVEPDLEAKIAGLQSPRGWGLFLIQNMVDEVNIDTDADHHTVELIINLEGSL